MQMTAADPCWVCLCGEEEGELSAPCKCVQRPVHRRCLARWQLQAAGKQEERFCRFCNTELPDWTVALCPKEAVPYATNANIHPVMAVRYKGQVVKLQVEPGPEGVDKFKRQLREALGIDARENLDISFQCKVPGTNELLMLKGLGSYSAATQCASLAVAQQLARTAHRLNQLQSTSSPPPQPQQQEQQHHQQQEEQQQSAPQPAPQQMPGADDTPSTSARQQQEAPLAPLAPRPGPRNLAPLQLPPISAASGPTSPVPPGSLPRLSGTHGSTMMMTMNGAKRPLPADIASHPSSTPSVGTVPSPSSSSPFSPRASVTWPGAGLLPRSRMSLQGLSPHPQAPSALNSSGPPPRISLQGLSPNPQAPSAPHSNSNSNSNSAPLPRINLHGLSPHPQAPSDPYSNSMSTSASADPYLSLFSPRASLQGTNQHLAQCTSPSPPTSQGRVSVLGGAGALAPLAHSPTPGAASAARPKAPPSRASSTNSNISSCNSSRSSNVISSSSGPGSTGTGGGIKAVGCFSGLHGRSGTPTGGRYETRNPLHIFGGDQ